MSAPRNPGLLGPNRGTRGTKVAFVRLSNEARSTSTDYVELISGAGAPSGGYGRDAGATLAYFRTDASDATTALYLTANGGTTWTATATAGGLALDAATDITIATGVATLTGPVHTLRGEGAAADAVDRISGMADAEVAYLLASAEQITIRDASVGGGNIATDGDTSIVLETGDAAMAVRSGAVITVTPLALAAGIAPGHLALAQGSIIVGNAGAQGSALDLSAADHIGIGNGTTVVALALPTTGVVVKTAAGTVAGRTLTAGAGISVNDGDGVAGNPTVSQSSEALDENVVAVIAVADSASAATDVAGTIQLNKAINGTTAIDSARQVVITADSTQYEPSPAPKTTVTFGTATTGSIIDSGNGWALIQTDASGAFACTVTNSADETVYFRCKAPELVSDIATRVQSVSSIGDDATWIA